MTWNELISKEQHKHYYIDMVPILRSEYSNYECYPSKENIFKAMYSIKSPEDVKVVIIGQDPYHEPGQAMGLSFSVPNDVLAPPSLVNIINELEREYNTKYNNGNDLTFWANQGVLLLNSTLTVRRGKANSHANIGWQIFTDNIIEYLGSLNKPMVFMLWGKFAKSKKKLINNNSLILETTHPSPLSANKGFLGCDHFIKCNEYLKNNNVEQIDWFGVNK